MFKNIIPSAHAQFTATVKETAVAGKDVAVETSEAGVQSLFSFIAKNIDNWIAGIIIIIVSWIIAKMIAGGIKSKIIEKKGEEIHESALILIDRVTTIVILGIGVTIAAAINGLNFAAVIGALSLGIGFALKDIIGNFFAGILMLSQDRVKIGDLIKVNDIIGTIVSIDVRATVLQAIDGTEVVIPNQSMLNETLISYSTNPFRRIELIVGVDYNTDLPMVTSLIKGILDKNVDIVPKPEPLILVDEFSDSSINIKILFWIESSNNWMKIRSNLANRIKKTFNELGINIPFPIRTLKLDEDDRTFLKTMDSYKKGIVPERKQTPTKDQVINSAAGTEHVPQIPIQLFDEKTVAIPPPSIKAEPKKEEEAKKEKKPEEKPAKPRQKEEESDEPAPPSHL